MNFRSVLSLLVERFDEQSIHYALMGGLAFGIWGLSRSTVDIDFLVRRDDLEKIDRIMQELGYECKFTSENVSQYVSPLKIYGEVDFLHAFREASLAMLGHAVEKEIFGGSLTIKVLRPEDLIGLKMQAIGNNPSRREADMEDIRVIVSLHGEHLDWLIVEGYARTLGMMDLYEAIRKTG